MIKTIGKSLEGRRSMSFFAFQGKLYVLGGSDDDKIFNDFGHVLDLTTKHWE